MGPSRPEARPGGGLRGLKPLPPIGSKLLAPHLKWTSERFKGPLSPEKGSLLLAMRFKK